MYKACFSKEVNSLEELGELIMRMQREGVMVDAISTSSEKQAVLPSPKDNQHDEFVIVHRGDKTYKRRVRKTYKTRKHKEAALEQETIDRLKKDLCPRCDGKPPLNECDACGTYLCTKCMAKVNPDNKKDNICKECVERP